MKRFVFILGGIAVLFVAVLYSVFVWFMTKTEQEKNRDKTQAARAARWPKEPDIKPIGSDATERQMNEFLDSINEKKDEKET